MFYWASSQCVYLLTSIWLILCIGHYTKFRYLNQCQIVLVLPCIVTLLFSCSFPAVIRSSKGNKEQNGPKIIVCFSVSISVLNLSVHTVNVLLKTCTHALTHPACYILTSTVNLWEVKCSAGQTKQKGAVWEVLCSLCRPVEKWSHAGLVCSPAVLAAPSNVQLCIS